MEGTTEYRCTIPDFLNYAVPVTGNTAYVFGKYVFVRNETNYVSRQKMVPYDQVNISCTWLQNKTFSHY